MINVTIINKTTLTLVSITGRVILPTCTLEITDYNASVHYSLHCDSGSFIISPIISKKYKITNFGKIRAYNSENNTIIVEED